MTKTQLTAKAKTIAAQYRTARAHNATAICARLLTRYEAITAQLGYDPLA